MDIKTLESFKLSDAIFFHDELNKNLWDENNKLHPKVKDQLILIAKDFIDELGIKDLNVKDITISGSNAAYTYTKHSDLDLHILVDMSKLPNNEVYKELFTAKKNLYNDSHDITVHGVPVELYVQDSNEPVVSLGEYSILHDKWLKIPTKRRANFDQTITKQKYDKLLHIIKKALKSKDLEQIENIISTIKRYRKAGLDKGGEFGPENLAYKALRTQGYIDKLYNLKQLLHSRELSIEDYDPNGPPPGPEFKPTMPAGTVRVDVSDVYDWYKLGQHISNMKGLGKHDFGKGPPSTVMAFGDEDLEHQYIKALQKTGLSTTDIDPFDPKQPKSIPRQKVDPTYNVNEKINPEILKKNFNKQKVIQTKKGPITLVATTPATQEEVFPQFYIKGYNSDGKQMAYLRLNIRDLEKFGFFGPKKDIKNAYLVAGNVSVYDEYQKLGIAREMYKFVQELGNDIKPSDTQTSAGKAMWNSFKRDGAFAEDQTLQFAAEKTPAVNPYGGLKDNQFRGEISEMPDTSGPVGVQPGGWRTYRPKVDEGSEQLDVDYYMNEGCGIFAVAKALNSSNAKIYVISKNEGEAWSDNFPYELTHVFVYIPNQGTIDVKGNRTPEQMAKDFHLSKNDYSIKGPFSPKEFYSRFMGNSDAKPLYGTKQEINQLQKQLQVKQDVAEGASGYIPSNAEKDDPRFKTALTVDIKPDTMKKDAKKFGNKISRAGIPPTLNPSGKF